MYKVPVPSNEDARLEELNRLQILDSEQEAQFNEIVELASRICKTPMSLITLVDENRQWVKAKVGLDLTESDRNDAFCAHTILGDSVFEVPNALEDERFVNNPFVVNESNIRFYAGIPLVSENGFNLGAICVLDTVPRKLTEDQIFALDVLSRQIIKLFDLRLRNLQIEAQNSIMENQKNHLLELSEIQNKIISIVAHDVRSPVASLRNVINLKKQNDISADEMNEFMDMLSKQLDGTMSLLSNLVEWGGILIKKSAAKWNEIDLFTLIESIFKDLEVAALVKHNRLVNDVVKGTKVWADENMLKFIIRNLMSNAIKFTENGAVSIASSGEKTRTRILIKDTGIGMNEEIRSNLFKANRSSSRKGTKKEEGSGLGLILSKEFAENLGSDIQVESEVGKGSIFSFTVPAV
ncbi:MAG: GAF domain-containing sensor histidine kinase [Sediminibacterium sp.]|jgi:signal transduction histidine kinase|nr:GAF domain-containing sensor histidine kinase [Chitinophagaceae bacterium]MCA6447302.1 GAF domain-containing sensor histidine kinase [Chitinophagaceae bacterium]